MIETIGGIVFYFAGAFASWYLRSRINRDALLKASKGDPANMWAIMFISAVFWPITMPFMFIGAIQRRFMRQKPTMRQRMDSPDGYGTVKKRKPKSQRGKR